MSKIVNTHLDFNNVGRIQNLPNGIDPQDPATVSQLNAAVEGLAWKDSARVATQSNINLSSPGTSLDSVTLTANDRVLVRSQIAASENGLYIWNGPSVAMTRALDAATAVDLEQAITTVEEGSSAGATFRQTAVNFILDADAVNWTSFGQSSPAATETTAGIAEIATQAEVDAGTDDQRMVSPAKLASWMHRPKRYSATFGDGSATQHAITHNLGTRDVVTQVTQTAAPYAEVICDVETTTTNSVTLRFASAPASNSLRLTVLA